MIRITFVLVGRLVAGSFGGIAVIRGREPLQKQTDFVLHVIGGKRVRIRFPDFLPVAFWLLDAQTYLPAGNVARFCAYIGQRQGVPE